MRRSGIGGLFIALGLGACSPDDPIPSRGDRNALLKFRASIRETIGAARSIALLELTPIPDGGSLIFRFKTDSGAQVRLQAHHQNDGLGGEAGGKQVFTVLSDDSEDAFTLGPRSALEAQWIALLEICTIAPPADREDPTSLTPATRDWILARMKDRSIPWSRCP